jgi:hypothetical protein
MDTQKLLFNKIMSEATGKEHYAASVFIEELLKLRGGCENPNLDEDCQCSECVFSNGHNCGKLFLAYWLDEVERGKR